MGLQRFASQSATLPQLKQIKIPFAVFFEKAKGIKWPIKPSDL